MRQSGEEREDNGKVVCSWQSVCNMAYSVASSRSWVVKDSREWQEEEASVWLGGRSSPSLPEARQLINSQLGACCLTKVGIKIKKITSFSFTHSTVAMREREKKKACESLFSLPPLPPTFPKPESSRDRQSSKSPSGLSPWKLSPFFIWSCPPVAMVTQHLLPNSAPVVTGFGICQAIAGSASCLLRYSAPEGSGSSHTFPAEWTFIQKAGYREKRG